MIVHVIKPNICLGFILRVHEKAWHLPWIQMPSDLHVLVWCFYTWLLGILITHTDYCSYVWFSTLNKWRKMPYMELDMRPLPRARVKLGGRTRSPRFWCKKSFDPCDPKSKFEPISFEEGSTWCICMSYINKLRNRGDIAFLVKITFWPLWPQMTPGWPLTP